MPRDAIYGLSLHKFSGPPLSRVTVVTGRDSSFAIMYTVFPDLRPVSIASRSESVNLGFFILLSPFSDCPRTVRAQGHASMEKPFLKVNAAFPHGGRGQSPCPPVLDGDSFPVGNNSMPPVASPRLGTSGCDYTGRIEFDKKPCYEKQRLRLHTTGEIWYNISTMLKC